MGSKRAEKGGKSYMFRIVQRILKWAEEYRTRIYIGFVFAFINGIFIAMPVMIATYGLSFIIEDVNGSRRLETKHIVLVLAFMLTAVFGRFLFSYLRSSSQDTVAYEMLAKQRIKIGNILKRVPLGFFKANSTGELVSAVTTDLSFMEMHAMNMVDSVVNGYIMIVTMIVCLFFFNWEMAVISLIGLLLSTFFLWCLGKKSKVNAPVHQEAQDSMIAASIEYLRGIAMVKSFNKEGVSYEGVKKAFQDSKNINIKIEKEYVIYNFLHLFSLKATSVALILLAAYQTLHNQMDLPVMIMIDIFSFVIFISAEGLNNAAHVLEILDATFDKLEKIELAKFIDDNGNDIKPEYFNIEFNKVSFAYDNKLVVKDVSFVIPQNTTTAIVGPSGSGKTTICNLIARFYDVNEGEIKLGGHDLKEFTCDSLLSQISMVFQKVYLFNDSIANNIKFGNPNATLEEIIKAAKKAKCHDFIMNLPNQYDTVINEGGNSLSGGEKQRISIARAILKDAPIIILDEATASVDPENEHLIQQAIVELTKGKTIIMIAHRLATIEHSDQILVMDHGRVVQKGKHNELILKEGIYKQFISIRKKAEDWNISNEAVL
jgi:ATP-binding cassette subfamily B protein IrtB